MGCAAQRRICALVAAGLLAACSSVRQTATGSLLREVCAAVALHDDLELVADALPTYLLLLEGLIHGDPDDPDLLRSAAEGYTATAALVETRDPRRAQRLYARGRHFGLACLVARRPETAPILEGPFPLFDTIDRHLHRRDLPYVFWAASAWGAWIGAHADSMAALADLPRVIHLMEWVLQRDEGYRGGSPHVFLGVCHAALPPLLGGDPEASRRHFERALELSGRADLMVQVQMARFYARQTFDRGLYVSLLEEVLSRPIGAVPELTLQNAAARRLARGLLEEVDVYF